MRALRPAGHLLLATLATFPLVLRPFDGLVGSPDVDVWNHAWGPWWFWTSLSAGRLPWHTDLLMAPAGGVLWFIDPLLALTGAPLVPLLGPAAAFNLAVLFWVAMGSWAAHRFAGAMGAHAHACWVASCGFVCSAWVVSELSNGITEAANIGPVALALALTERAARMDAATPRGVWVRAWAGAGAAVGLAALASPYLGLGAGLAALVRGLPHVRRAWVGGLVGAAIAAVPTQLLRLQLQAADAIVKHPEGMNQQLAAHNAVDPRTFLAPLGFQSVDLSSEGFVHSMYLGIGLAGLALVGFWLQERRPWLWLAAALVCAVCALGPYLFFDGAFATAGGARLRMPWWVLQQLAPGLAITHPLRLAVPALAVASALAAVGAGRLLPGTRSLWLIPVVLADGLLLSGAPWPLPIAEARPPAVAAHIAAAAQSPQQAVLDLPPEAGSTMATSRYLWWQTAHGQPIPYGPDVRARTSALFNHPSFRLLAQHAHVRPDPEGRTQLPAPGPGQRSARALQQQGIRWIVLHPEIDPAAAAPMRQQLEMELGSPQTVGDALIWALD